MTTVTTTSPEKDSEPQLTLKEKLEQQLKAANKYFQNDEHAGAVAGLLLGALFLIFGLCIMLIPEDSIVPRWRQLTGIVLVSIGCAGIIASASFMIAD